MNKIFEQEILKNVPDRGLEELVSRFLNCDHGLSRSMAAIQIALKLAENYDKYSKLLLNEMNKEVHFLGIRFGIKSAWTIAIVLIENLKQVDYSKIKKEFDKWDNEEKEDLLEWLKSYPEHIKILKEGNL